VSSVDELQRAFVLHSRPYRETSLLVDLFTKNHGIVATIAKGVRGRKNSRRALLQPFQPILCRWRGRGELATITDIDSNGSAYKLAKNELYSGLYVNELLMRLIHRHDPHEILFEQYQNLLEQLQIENQLEPSLRSFEFSLLDELGYGLNLALDVSGEDIKDALDYWLTPQGVLQPINEISESHPRHFQGGLLNAVAQRKWHKPEVLGCAKRLIRLSLAPLIGDKPLQSRKLFRSK